MEFLSFPHFKYIAQYNVPMFIKRFDKARYIAIYCCYISREYLQNIKIISTIYAQKKRMKKLTPQKINSKKKNNNKREDRNVCAEQLH